MSISSPEDAHYIDTELPLIAPKMAAESSTIIKTYTTADKESFKHRIQLLKSSTSFETLLAIQRIAKLCEDQARLRHRVGMLKNKIQEKNHLNRLEMVKLDVLRAEKSKSNENINWITTKSVELDSTLNSLRSEIRETKSKVQDTRTECLKRGRKILAEYYKIINGEQIIDSISKMTPHIKAVVPELKCSSKTKRMFEENSIISQAQNISRFLNYTSGVFLYPLRFNAAQFNRIESHNDLTGVQSGEQKFEHYSYLESNAYLYIQSNLFHIEGCRYIKKNSSLEKFLMSSKSDNLNGAIPHRKGESKMLRNALFATSSSNSSSKTKKREIESDIPDLT